MNEESDLLNACDNNFYGIGPLRIILKKNKKQHWNKINILHTAMSCASFYLLPKSINLLLYKFIHLIRNKPEELSYSLSTLQYNNTRIILLLPYCNHADDYFRL